MIPWERQQVIERVNDDIEWAKRVWHWLLQPIRGENYDVSKDSDVVYSQGEMSFNERVNKTRLQNLPVLKERMSAKVIE